MTILSFSKDEIMSAAQQLRQEAIQEAIQKVAKSMLKETLSVPVIQKVTGLSKEEIEKLGK